MNLWLNRLASPVPAGPATPADLARYELESAGIRAVLQEDPSMGDAYRIDPQEDGLFRWPAERRGCSMPRTG